MQRDNHPFTVTRTGTAAFAALASHAALALGCASAMMTCGACGGEQAPSSTRSAATAAPPAALKVAFLYNGPADDGGWNAAHERARKAAVAHFGARLQTTVIDNKSDPADVEGALRALINAGNTLIFAANLDFAQTVEKLAASTPAVRFVQLSGADTSKNLGSYALRGYEAAYLAGVVAGKMTKSNLLGIVGSVPAPQVILDINAFELGAQSINPAAKTKVAWVNKWFDPPKEAGEAQALIDQRADVLFQTTQSLAVIQTAEKAGRLAIGWGSNMGKQGPHAHLASAVLDWTPLYQTAIEQALDGNWTAGNRWLGVKDGAVDLVALDNQIPPDARARVEAVKVGLKSGSFNPWSGPIVDQTGKELIAAGQQADDATLHALHVYVRGIDTNQ